MPLQLLSVACHCNYCQWLQNFFTGFIRHARKHQTVQRLQMPIVDLGLDTLDHFRVGHLHSLYYVPDYVSEAEEASLLREIHGAKARWTQAGAADVCGADTHLVPELTAMPGEPDRKLTQRSTHQVACIVQVSGRRLQSYGGSVTPKGLLAAKLPAWLAALGARMARDTGIFGEINSRGNSSGGNGGTVAQPNHVLVNAYKPGDGIMVSRRRHPCRSPFDSSRICCTLHHPAPDLLLCLAPLCRCSRLRCFVDVTGA